MKQWNKFALTLSVLALFFGGVSPFGGIAFGATPVVTVLPPFKQGTVTPTRLAADAVGNIYVTDPHAAGVLKFDKNGSLLQNIALPLSPDGKLIEPGGVAINPVNGDLLVTQGTYAVALDSVNNYALKARFGTFKSAFSITVDSRTTGGTGRIYVSDIAGYCVQVFSSTYSPVTIQGLPGVDVYSYQPTNSFGGSQVASGNANTTFNRPAGVAFDNANGRVAVVDSINGKIKFFDVNGVFYNSLGSFGYDPTFIRFTYPQAITFEYTNAAKTALNHAYILDTYQAYVMTLDATLPMPAYPAPVTNWPRILDIGSWGHGNGNLIAPSDVMVDTADPDNNRLLVTNGFGSVTVYGLNSLQPYNVAIDTITNTSMRLTWSNPTTAAFNAIRVYRSTVEGQLGTQVGGDLPSSTTTLNNTGLTPYTTYYFTVHIVDATNQEGTNLSQISAKTTATFNLSVNINGNGSVNGTLSCTSGTCTTSLPSDTQVTLTATGTGQSVFKFWSGDYGFITENTVTFPMDAAKTLTASFEATKAFRVDGAYFDNLQDAYDAAPARPAPDAAVIKVLEGAWPSTLSTLTDMSASQNKEVIIEGGYDVAFTNNTGKYSTLVGRTNLSAGKVIMKQIRLK
jgi:hypothetical protein